MLSAAPATPRDSRLAPAVIASLLALLISCLPYLVQGGTESQNSRHGLVDKSGQIALSTHSESLRLHHSTGSGKNDADGEPDSHSWLTPPRPGLLLAASPDGIRFSLSETRCRPSGCAHLLPPLRAPPLV